MPNRLSLEYPGYAVLEAPSVDEQWTGASLTLQNETAATITATPNASTIFAYQNVSPFDNDGSMLLTSGSVTVPLASPGGNQQSLVYISNWRTKSLKVTNTSPGTGTPIIIQLVGPGLPGCKPVNLPLSTQVALTPGGCAKGVAAPRWMQLAFENDSGNQSIVALIGGPQDASGNNAYLFGINFSSNTGPGTGNQPPDGYYATSASTNITFQFNWGAYSVFCANFSGSTAGDTTVVFRPL